MAHGRPLRSSSMRLSLSHGHWKLPPVVRLEFGDQEWELLGGIHPYEELLSDITRAVGIGEDDIDDLAHTAEPREAYFHPSQRSVPSIRFGGRGIDRWI